MKEGVLEYLLRLRVRYMSDLSPVCKKVGGAQVVVIADGKDDELLLLGGAGGKVEVRFRGGHDLVVDGVHQQQLAGIGTQLLGIVELLARLGEDPLLIKGGLIVSLQTAQQEDAWFGESRLDDDGAQSGGVTGVLAGVDGADGAAEDDDVFLGLERREIMQQLAVDGCGVGKHGDDAGFKLSVVVRVAAVFYQTHVVAEDLPSWRESLIRQVILGALAVAVIDDCHASPAVGLTAGPWAVAVRKYEIVAQLWQKD